MNVIFSRLLNNNKEFTYLQVSEYLILGMGVVAALPNATDVGC